MASRAELIQCCQELNIPYQGLRIDEMTDAVRKKADELFGDKSYKISADGLSDTLKRFLSAEYDYKILNKEGKEIKF